MNQLTYHLIVFLALLASGLTIILTGHDHSPLLGQLLGGALGGTGGAGLGSLLFNFFGGSSPQTASVPASQKQTGNARLSFVIMVFMVSLCICLVTIAGCASLGLHTSQQKIAASCATASAAVKSLTVVQQAGLVAHADDQGIELALGVINPICEAPNQPTYSSAELSAVNSAVQELLTYQAKYHATPTGQ